MLAGKTDELEELENSCSGELTVADPPHSSRPVRPSRLGGSEIDARTRREHEHAPPHLPGEGEPSLNSGSPDNPARSTSRAMRPDHKGHLVGFPVRSAQTLDRADPDPEEAVRRQRVEAERLSRLAPANGSCGLMAALSVWASPEPLWKPLLSRLARNATNTRGSSALMLYVRTSGSVGASPEKRPKLNVSRIAGSAVSTRSPNRS